MRTTLHQKIEVQAQAMYDLRELTGFCSGEDLARIFSSGELIDPPLEDPEGDIHRTCGESLAVFAADVADTLGIDNASAKRFAMQGILTAYNLSRREKYGKSADLHVHTGDPSPGGDKNVLLNPKDVFVSEAVELLNSSTLLEEYISEYCPKAVAEFFSATTGSVESRLRATAEFNRTQ